MERYIVRMDELGKITIPKNIRDNLGFTSLENVEILVKKNEIVVRTYSPILKIKEIAKAITDTLSYALNHNVIITDLNNIIVSSDKSLLNKKVSENLKFSIFRRENILEIHNKNINISSNTIINTPYIINSIVSKGNVIGLLIIYDELKGVDDIDYKISSVVANFIGKYVE